MSGGTEENHETPVKTEHLSNIRLEHYRYTTLLGEGEKNLCWESKPDSLVVQLVAYLLR
jgi:hypothetical protein